MLEQVTMEVGSVTNFEDVQSVLRKHPIERVAGLVFFAFRGAPDRLHDEMSIMVQGTANLFEAARIHGIQRVVFPSSIAYYGPQELHGDGERPLLETDPSLARSVYGVGKRLCEVLAHEYNSRADMDIISMRIPVVYGPGGRMGARGTNLIATEGAINGAVTLPFGPAERVIIGHVQDVAEAVVRLLLTEQLQHKHYNVGGHTLSFRDIADIGCSIIPGLRVDYAADTDAIELPYLIDNTRIVEELGIVHRPPAPAYRELAALTRAQAGMSPL
ncbi:MAG: NAD(P)-dependent oxidoreductase [Chromatiales bacterium]|nr:NAD(P)-dependent oxidoreductase [Chromatiales bacterium]